MLGNAFSMPMFPEFQQTVLHVVQPHVVERWAVDVQGRGNLGENVPDSMDIVTRTRHETALLKLPTEAQHTVPIPPARWRGRVNVLGHDSLNNVHADFAIPVIVYVREIPFAPAQQIDAGMPLTEREHGPLGILRPVRELAYKAPDLGQ